MDVQAHRVFVSVTRDAGTATIAILFADELRLRLRNFNSHRLFLNAVLGRGSGVSVMLLLLLSAAQFVSSLTLVVPTLYKRLGTIVPSVALGSTLALEMLLYHGFDDYELTIKAIVIESSLLLIGVLRRHNRARNEAIGTPLHGKALAVEAYVRKLCTRMRAGYLLPPVALLVSLQACLYYRFWSYTGAEFEIKRTSFCKCLAQCALMMLLSSQDRSPRLHVAESMYRALREKTSDRVYRVLSFGGSASRKCDDKKKL